MTYQISSTNKIIKGTIDLPASKSISNRVLIINALNYSPYPIHNLSDCDDTNVMLKVLTSNTNKFDIGHAGTAMRFLTSYLSKIVGEWEITGSSRMKQRPIATLVDALVQLGAKIEYLENDGFPPLKIWGSHLKGKTLKLDGSISSQFITALLLIAPTIEGGLTIQLENKIISKAYIDLTLELMKKFGILYKWEGQKIIITEQHYLPIDYTIEADWSGASYWYQIAALSDSADIHLQNLTLDSLQGDSAIHKWFTQFGVISEKTKEGTRLIKTSKITPDFFNQNFTDNPDVAQTIAVLCLAKKVPFHFTGLETLKIKETDRIAALQNECAKFGATFTEPQNGELAWDGTINESLIVKNPSIKTYNDHRMALAFAPIVLSGQPIQIENPMVITKSYPNFWNDLNKIGILSTKLK